MLLHYVNFRNHNKPQRTQLVAHDAYNGEIYAEDGSLIPAPHLMAYIIFDNCVFRTNTKIYIILEMVIIMVPY